MEKYVKDIKLIEKKLISDTNKIKEFQKLISSFREYDSILLRLKEDVKTKKSNAPLIENATAKSKILEPLNKFYKNYLESQEELKKSTTVKELYKFLEKFRTYRTYHLTENLLERFISGFLNNFAEKYTFKTEFIGQINLVSFAELISGKKENSVIKIEYTQIPKTIKEAYNLKLDNFIIETHNMKLLFRKDYLVEITSNSNMIQKIDKIARECNIEYK